MLAVRLQYGRARSCRVAADALSRVLRQGACLRLSRRRDCLAGAAPQFMGHHSSRAFSVTPGLNGRQAAGGSQQAQPGAKSVEDTYRKMDQVQHVLMRPGMYIGGTKAVQSEVWTADLGVVRSASRDTAGMVATKTEVIPGLLKVRFPRRGWWRGAHRTHVMCCVPHVVSAIRRNPGQRCGSQTTRQGADSYSCDTEARLWWHSSGDICVQ